MESLVNIDNKPVVKPLITLLKDKEWYIRDTAAYALGKIKDPSAVEPLIDALSDKRVRWRASWALGEIKDPRAVEPLISLSRVNWWNDKNVLDVVVCSLANIGTPSVKPLVAALKDENIYTRSCASQALGEIKDSRAVEPLIDALKDEEPFVRKRAARALGKIRDSRAVKPLIDVLRLDSRKHETNGARGEATQSLEDITGNNFGNDFVKWQDWWGENKTNFLKGR